MTQLAWDTLLPLDGTGPLHRQLERALREAIRAGRLPLGSALPPSRALAYELRCSRWAVTQAYGQLTAEGYLQARVGSATRVHWGPAQDNTLPVGRSAATPVRFDLAPGLPDLSAFPRTRWLEALRSVVVGMPHQDLGYPAPAGHPALRATLAEYLERVRGAAAEPDDVVLTRGVTDGMARICQGLRSHGIDSVAVEEPGWTRLREAMEATGMRVVPVPVDADGLRVERLAEHSEVRAAIVTAAHQFPMGVVLSAQRRDALLDWARRVDGLVLEDDYDAEFRYDRPSTPALQGSAPTHVALLGSLSKTLSPALGIGWLVLRGPWRDRLPRLAHGSTPPTLDQAAFEQFIRGGSYDRQLRRLRQLYRTKRDRLVQAVATNLPDWRVSGAAAGLHLVLHAPAGIDPAETIERAASSGVRLADLAGYCSQPGSNSGLVLGYGNIAERDIEAAVGRLAAAAGA